MKNIWAVARHTFAQCLRMKIAMAFIALLIVGLAAMPFVMKGDGTLAGSIRTTLNYGITITSVLLSLVTILVTVSVVTDDVRDKYIVLLVSKPLARWQYLLGRWLGVVLLNAVLLGVAGVSIYLLAQHLRDRPAESVVDRKAVESEVFAARQEVKPQPPDFSRWVAMRIEKLKKEGRYEIILKSFEQEPDRKRRGPKQRLVDELLKQAHSAYETAGPMRGLTWRFNDIRLDEASATGRGRVRAAREGRYRIEAAASLVGRLIVNGPVQIQGVRGRVLRQYADYFDVTFSPEDIKRHEVRSLNIDSEVQITADPTLQFRYTVKPIGKSSKESQLYRVIEVRRPLAAVKPDGTLDLNSAPGYGIRGWGPVKTKTTVTVPAVGVVAHDSVVVRYINIPAPPTGPTRAAPSPPLTVQIPYQDVSLLYRVGGFEANFLRVVLLVFCQLVFLAALGVFFGSFLSFPVAAMSCLVLLGCGWILEWLSEAVHWGDFSSAEAVVSSLGSVVLWVVKVLMPDLTATCPADKLVDGIYVSWAFLGRTALMAIVIRATFYLAVGCFIFHRRELARVQV